MIYSVYKNGVDLNCLWTGYRGKKLPKQQKAEWTHTDRRVSCTVAIDSVNKEAWKDDKLVKVLTRAVMLEYYYGTPGWITMTTCDVGLTPMSEVILELAK